MVDISCLYKQTRQASAMLGAQNSDVIRNILCKYETGPPPPKKKQKNKNDVKKNNNKKQKQQKTDCILWLSAFGMSN